MDSILGFVVRLQISEGEMLFTALENSDNGESGNLR
jgi:hypothetical protein